MKLRSSITIALLLSLLTPNIGDRAYASTFDSLTNTTFDTIDDAGYGETSYAIRFGSTLQHELKYDTVYSSFIFGGSLKVRGNLSGSSLRVDQNADVFGRMTVSGALTTKGTLSGRLLVVSGNASFSGSAVFKNGVTVKGSAGLSGAALRVSGAADIHGPLAVSGSLRGDGDFTINDDRTTAADAVLTFGNSTTNQTLKYVHSLQKFQFSKDLSIIGTISGSTLRIDGPADIHGALSASGAVHFDSDLSINDDRTTAADAVLTFGNSTTNQDLKYIHANQRFQFSTNINVLGSISGTSLIVSGASSFSGAALFRTSVTTKSSFSGSSFFGSGLGDCSNTTTSKLVYNPSTGKFLCATDQTGAGGGLTFATASGIFVNQGGDTMTGTLNLQYGNAGTPITAPILNVRGTMSGRSLHITGTGSASQPLMFMDISRGFVGIGTNNPKALLTVSGGTILSTPGGVPLTMSGIELGTSGSGMFVAGNYAYVGRNSVAGNDLVTIDISNPSAPETIGGIDVSADVRSVFVSTKHIFLGLSGPSASSGFVILDATNPATPLLVGRMNFGANVNTVYVSGKYAYVGSNNVSGPCSTTNSNGCELRIIDFSNPQSPIVLTGANLGVSVQSIYVQNRYAYIGLASDGGAGNDFRILDLQNPARVSFVGGMNVSNSVRTVFATGRYAFIGLDTDAANEFRVIDVSSKASPTLAGGYETNSSVNSITVAGDYARIGVNSVSGDDYFMFDMTNMKSPKKIGGMDFGADVKAVALAGRTAFVTLSSVTGVSCANNCDFRILGLDGIEGPAGSFGSLFAGSLSVADNVRFDNNLYVRNAANIGRGGIISKGPISVQGASTGAVLNTLDVRNSVGTSLFSVRDDGRLTLGATRWGYHIPLTTAATVLTAVGLTTMGTAIGTISAQPALANATRMYIQYASAATINTAAGFTAGPYAETRPVYRPRFSTIIRTDTAIDTRRLWAGLAESTLIAVTHATGPSVSTVDFAAIGFDTSISANWRCCTGDGVFYSCMDMGLPVVASTEYSLTVDYSQANMVQCSVAPLAGSLNPVTVNKTTNISSIVTGLGLYNAITTLSAAARNHQINRMALEQN